MKYQVNDIVSGIVSGIQSYGAFVKIGNESGLIHISEISPLFVKNIEDYVKVGQVLKLKVIGILEDKHLYRLSLKQVEQRYRQNIRPLKSPNPKKKYKIPLNQQDFSPLEEHLEVWIEEAKKKMEEK